MSLGGLVIVSIVLIIVGIIGEFMGDGERPRSEPKPPTKFEKRFAAFIDNYWPVIILAVGVLFVIYALGMAWIYLSFARIHAGF